MSGLQEDVMSFHDRDKHTQPKECIGCVWGRWSATKQYCMRIQCVKETEPTQTIADLPKDWEDLIVYIDIHMYRRELGLDDAAKFMKYSRSALSRTFTARFGIGFKEYLTNQRMKKARELIKSGRNVSEACYEVGYSDKGNFSRKFIQIYGISPSKL